MSQLRNGRCVRTERYKLVENYNDRSELYDLAEDPDELTNRAEDHPELVAELHRTLVHRLR